MEKPSGSYAFNNGYRLVERICDQAAASHLETIGYRKTVFNKDFFVIGTDLAIYQHDGQWMLVRKTGR